MLDMLVMLVMLVMGCTLSNRGHITEKWAREPPCATPNASTHALPAQLLIEIGAPLGALPVAAGGRWDWQRPFPPGIINRAALWGWGCPQAAAGFSGVSSSFLGFPSSLPQVSSGFTCDCSGRVGTSGDVLGGASWDSQDVPKFSLGSPGGSRPAVLPPLNVAALPLHRNCARRSWVHTALPGHFGRSVPWHYARQSTTSLL
jgi:hypothetical protein